ncbi:MAG: D-glycero-beta-D-manno-heptose 1-phosphate adenylyltransferase [Desulfobacterales bacterium]|jgi:D-beta-D-heptose 7-phosphate kinase/D-beta-D-heptose 1-phosphate adenosyltransferase
MSPNEKILTLTPLLDVLAGCRKKGRRIVFTNGCFDLLHAGHVRYLAAARAEGDLLVVGLNSDESVRRIKPAGRPVVDQGQRAEVLAALACVDYVTIFDEPDPGRLIEAVAPDVLVKGADWPEDGIVGAAAVRRAGGRVVRVELVPEISTTVIIQRIRERFC